MSIQIETANRPGAHRAINAAAQQPGHASIFAFAIAVLLAATLAALVPASMPMPAYAANTDLIAQPLDLSTQGSQTEPTPQASKSTAKKTPAAHVAYRTHIQRKGWERGWKTDGTVSGTSGQSLRLEAINIKLANHPYKGSIRYRTHIQKRGWEKGWKYDGAMSGTSGKSLRLEAIQIQLTGEMAKRYDVYYRVHCQNIGWMGWAKNGASAGSAGYSYRLEAIQVKIVAKGSKAPGSTVDAFTKNMLPTWLDNANKASGSKGFSVRNGSLSSQQRRGLDSMMRNAPGNYGFIAINTKTGKTVSRNADTEIYTASAIKAPFVTSLCKYNAPGLSNWEEEMARTLQDSDNDTYRSLVDHFGASRLYAMMNSAGAWFDVSGGGYGYCTPRQLEKLWLVTKDFMKAKTGNVARLKKAFGGNSNSYYKVGWLPTSSSTGGVYTIGGYDGDVVYVVMGQYDSNGRVINVFNASQALINATMN